MAAKEKAVAVMTMAAAADRVEEMMMLAMATETLVAGVAAAALPQLTA